MGSAIVRRLADEQAEILVAERDTLDLTNQRMTEDWLLHSRPDAIFLAAGLVGGIHANSAYPADFIADNMAIALNVIRAAHVTGVKKLVALGSSCIYPKFASQPMSEDALLTGPLEPTNEWYAIAKIAAIKLCEAYRKQHRRREHDPSAEHGEQPIEDLHAGRHRDDRGHDAEERVDIGAGPHREEMMQPDCEGEDADP